MCLRTCGSWFSSQHVGPGWDPLELAAGPFVCWATSSAWSWVLFPEIAKGPWVGSFTEFQSPLLEQSLQDYYNYAIVLGTLLRDCGCVCDSQDGALALLSIFHVSNGFIKQLSYLCRSKKAEFCSTFLGLKLRGLHPFWAFGGCGSRYLVMCHVNASCGYIYFVLAVTSQVHAISLMITWERALWKASPIEGTGTEVGSCRGWWQWWAGTAVTCGDKNSDSWPDEAHRSLEQGHKNRKNSSPRSCWGTAGTWIHGPYTELTTVCLLSVKKHLRFTVGIE